MAYKLFKNDPLDPPRREISYNELRDKQFWCQLGEDKENAFVKFMNNNQSIYQIQIHPQKRTNPYHPDLLVTLNDQGYVGEVKTKNSPLFYAKYYGVDPQYALTMDLKDSFNYSRLLLKGIDLLIFVWVKWEAHEMHTNTKTYRVEPMSGTWVTKFSKIRELELGEKPPKIHWYKEDFRQPPVFTEKSEPEWYRQLVAFDERLKFENGVKNITSKKYQIVEGEYYPSGQSSASYVFNLNDSNIFQKIT